MSKSSDIWTDFILRSVPADQQARVLELWREADLEPNSVFGRFLFACRVTSGANSSFAAEVTEAARQNTASAQALRVEINRATSEFREAFISLQSEVRKQSQSSNQLLKAMHDARFDELTDKLQGLASALEVASITRPPAAPADPILIAEVKALRADVKRLRAAGRDWWKTAVVTVLLVGAAFALGHLTH
ncbi:hypothetical protein [Verrucomicrobium sp. GAS474]|uniref:hypothetical protein n=1 Tax=Verrucomicrobium sp. GAS474 TaxID=1882831 RepID=UPI0012FF7707|nr:hypothetical protein [Verrucomicrobium sp. GAS474]